MMSNQRVSLAPLDSAHSSPDVHDTKSDSTNHFSTALTNVTQISPTIHLALTSRSYSRRCTSKACQ
jgi:hypothetical protein